MIGLVIVTHGGLASEFLAAMEHVLETRREGGPFRDIFDFVDENVVGRAQAPVLVRNYLPENVVLGLVGEHT